MKTLEEFFAFSRERRHHVIGFTADWCKYMEFEVGKTDTDTITIWRNEDFVYIKQNGEEVLTVAPEVYDKAWIKFNGG